MSEVYKHTLIGSCGHVVPVDSLAVLLVNKLFYGFTGILYSICVVVDFTDTGIDGLGVVGIRYA